MRNANKNMVDNLDYEGIKFPVSEDFGKIEKKIFVQMYFVMKMILFILIMYQIKNLKTVWLNF